MAFLSAKNINDSGYNEKRSNELLSRYNNLTDIEKNELVQLHTGMVFSIVNQFNSNSSRKNSDFFDELMSAGFLGLQKAFLSFRFDKKIKFSTYASRCIRNEILMYFRRIKRYDNIVSFSSVAVEKKDSEIFLEEMIASPINTPHEIAIEQEKLERLKEVLNTLSIDELELISKSYGLENSEKMTQKALAEQLSCSQTHISRKRRSIEQKVYKKMNYKDIK